MKKAQDDLDFHPQLWIRQYQLSGRHQSLKLYETSLYKSATSFIEQWKL